MSRGWLSIPMMAVAVTGAPVFIGRVWTAAFDRLTPPYSRVVSHRSAACKHVLSAINLGVRRAGEEADVLCAWSSQKSSGMASDFE